MCEMLDRSQARSVYVLDLYVDVYVGLPVYTRTTSILTDATYSL